MKALFDKLTAGCSKKMVESYSDAYSFGIRMLAGPFREPMYAIGGFVLLAKEIIHGDVQIDKAEIFTDFKSHCYRSLQEGISLNPILNSFQHAVHKYLIDRELIDMFFESVETEMRGGPYKKNPGNSPVPVAAEIAGLMCLKVLCYGNELKYNELVPAARRFSLALHKIGLFVKIANENLLFSEISFCGIQYQDKKHIEAEIESDLHAGYQLISKLPPGTRNAVLFCYNHHRLLFDKIKKITAGQVVTQKIYANDFLKWLIAIKSTFWL